MDGADMQGAAVGKIDLKYINQFRDKTGKLRTFFRYRQKKYPLPDPSDPGFMAAYDRYRKSLVGDERLPEKGENSLGWLITRYKSSPEFKLLAERTRKDYEPILSAIGKEHGTKSWRQLTRKLVIEHIRDPLADKPRRADYHVAALSAVYAWAIKRDMATENPCHRIEKLFRKGDGYRAWTTAEIERFCGACTDHEHLIFMLALYTAQRAGDLVKMTWFQYDGEVIRLKQSKTGEPLIIAVHDALKAALELAGRSEGTILTRTDGKAYTSNGLSLAFSKATHRIGGLDGCTLHGLRTTHVTILAEQGVGARQIMATTGHRTLEMVQHYTRGAEQARMARDLVARLPNIGRTGSDKLGGEVTNRGSGRQKNA